ncbi:hypothetical protein QOZ80_1AG0035620 [Eleusine coracana subsp. coracana]|nr:hypothetical protein QOZ80_1AG0035620 [Eleusine coracana subsp. coracana]
MVPISNQEILMAAAISSSPESKEFPDWVLLLPVGRTRCYADAGAASAAVKDDPTAVAADTSNNRSGYLSFTLSPTPKVSYLDLHWPYDIPDAPAGLSASSSFVSVDENLLLIRIDQYPRGSDLFVYTARAPSPPSLRRLPACDKVIQGLAGRSRFLELVTDIGIMRRGDEDDYVVSDLTVSFKEGVNVGHDNDLPPMMAVLGTFSSKTGEWTKKEMRAPQPRGQNQFPLLWTCDGVVPFVGRYLCWVDYYSGLLIRDFSDEDSPCLSYVPFPAGGKQYSDKTRVDRNIPESFRRVAVSQGVVRFIHIGDDYWQETGGGLKVTVWNLKMVDSHGNWDVHHVIRLDNLWAHPTYLDHSLPRSQLEFPLVLKNDPGALFCVLREEECDGKTWIIKLDMIHLAITSAIPYTTEEIGNSGVAYESKVMSMNVGPPLIPSGFSKYLKNPLGNS